jgi:hypothetical protein
MSESVLKQLSPHLAQNFADKWKDSSSEKSDGQSFWRDFFIDVCGLTHLKDSGIEFERPVISSKKGNTNFIDVFWKNYLLIEQKSRGKNLDEAEIQARGYIVSLPPALRPPVIIVSDFAKIRIVEYLLNESHEFKLEDLPKNLHRFEAIISQNTKNVAVEEIEADQKASKLMANLYRQLEQNGYEGHDASVFMVRILFCLFADDTRMWRTGLFSEYLQDTTPDGKDTGSRIQSLFDWLNTQPEKRPKVSDELLMDFPYVNGGLFSERLNSFFFTPEMRTALLNASAYDWSSINPTIFGSLFQAIKSKQERRGLGEHYTTEASIDKVLNPLLLDEINSRIVDAWDNPNKLRIVKKDLGELKILDPACGSGNFLITAYKRLRKLELEVMQRIKQFEGTSKQVGLLDATLELDVKLEQMHGIESEEWSSQIANVALFLTDHQENMRLETVLGYAPNRFPLSHSAKIVHANSLSIDWKEVCETGDRTYVVGNPPFLGSQTTSKDQKEEQAKIWGTIKGAGTLDYVSNWYFKACEYLQHTLGRAAFVSTNSVTQGNQPSILSNAFSIHGMKIDFCHRTFPWESDASGKASVHCVIIGFSSTAVKTKKFIYEISDTNESKSVEAKQINGYLFDGNDVLIESRKKPIQSFVQKMDFGSMPNDGGLLSNIDSVEAELIRGSDPIATKYLRRLIGARELIEGIERWCLWLVDAEPSDIKNSKVLSVRVNGVKNIRISSPRLSTQKLAEKPNEFGEIRQPNTTYLAVPAHSSENRDYIPMALMPETVVASNALLTISHATHATFAVLQSKVFSLWNATVSGRIKNDYRISAEITYNNFPFPELNKIQEAQLEESAKEIIASREKFKDSNLGDLYGITSMPKELRNSHKANDKAVLAVYGLKPNSTDAEVLTRLFEMYSSLIEEANPLTIT